MWQFLVEIMMSFGWAWQNVSSQRSPYRFLAMYRWTDDYLLFRVLSIYIYLPLFLKTLCKQAQLLEIQNFLDICVFKPPSVFPLNPHLLQASGSFLTALTITGAATTGVITSFFSVSYGKSTLVRSLPTFCLSCLDTLLRSSLSATARCVQICSIV